MENTDWGWNTPPTTSHTSIVLWQSDAIKGPPMVGSQSVGIPKFALPQKSTSNGVSTSEFVLATPGTYELWIGGKQVDKFTIQAHQRLDFGIEFGLTATLIAIGLGVILWKFRRRANTG